MFLLFFSIIFLISFNLKYFHHNFSEAEDVHVAFVKLNVKPKNKKRKEAFAF